MTWLGAREELELVVVRRETRRAGLDEENRGDES